MTITNTVKALLAVTIQYLIKCLTKVKRQL